MPAGAMQDCRHQIGLLARPNMLFAIVCSFYVEKLHRNNNGLQTDYHLAQLLLGYTLLLY